MTIFSNKEFRNASWLIGGKIIQMLLSLVVGILAARYLGPSNYGTINYGLAYVSFFTAVCTLGLNNYIIKDFVDNPEQQGEVDQEESAAERPSLLDILTIDREGDDNG